MWNMSFPEPRYSVGDHLARGRALVEQPDHITAEAVDALGEPEFRWSHHESRREPTHAQPTVTMCECASATLEVTEMVFPVFSFAK